MVVGRRLKKKTLRKVRLCSACLLFITVGACLNDCKNRMNTFGFTGPLEGRPRIDCIYQNEASGNLFVTPSGAVGPRPDTDKF